MYDYNKYNSLGGWLLCYVVIQAIGLAGAIGSISDSIQLRDDIASSFVWVLVVIFSVVSPLLAALNLYFIFARPINALKNIRTVLMVEVGIAIIQTIILTVFVSSFNFEDAMLQVFQTTIILSSVISVIITVLWNLYFWRSERVKVYFGEVQTEDL